MRRTGTSSADRPRTLLPAARSMQAGAAAVASERPTGLAPSRGRAIIPRPHGLLRAVARPSPARRRGRERGRDRGAGLLRAPAPHRELAREHAAGGRPQGRVLCPDARRLRERRRGGGRRAGAGHLRALDDREDRARHGRDREGRRCRARAQHHQRPQPRGGRAPSAGPAAAHPARARRGRGAQEEARRDAALRQGPGRRRLRGRGDPRLPQEPERRAVPRPPHRPEVRGHPGRAAPPDEIVVRAFARVWLPLTISAVTTMIGFGSLMVNRITASWDLGLFAVVGVVCLPVTCLTYLPASLQLMPARLRSARSGKISPALSENLRRLAERAFGKRREILWGAAALALVALAGAWRIRVDSDFLYYFEPSSEVRRANETINQKIVGSNPFYIVIDGGAPGALRRWEVLKLIKDLQGFLARQPGITSSISAVDDLEVLEAGFNKQEEGGDLLIDEQEIGRAHV